MRSLRYLDALRRTGDGWRIAERMHTLDWSFQVPTTFAAFIKADTDRVVKLRKVANIRID